MKSIYLVLIWISIFLFCEGKQGPIGPQGPPGNNCQYFDPLPNIRWRTDRSFFIGQSNCDTARFIPMKGFCLFDNCYGMIPLQPIKGAIFPGLIVVDIPQLGNTNEKIFPIPNRVRTWHAIYLIRNLDGNAEPRVIPFIRVFSDLNNVIRSSQHIHIPTGNIPVFFLPEESHNFSPNILDNAYFIVLSGTNRGTIRKIISNTTGTINYDGDALNLSSNPQLPQDWIAVIPPGIGLGDFVYIGCIYLNHNGDVLNFYKNGFDYASYQEDNILKAVRVANHDSVYKNLIEPSWIYFGGHVPPTATHTRVFMTMDGRNANLPSTPQLYVYTDGSNHVLALYTATMTNGAAIWGTSDNWLLKAGAGSIYQQCVFMDITIPKVLVHVRVTGYSECIALYLNKTDSLN